MRSREIIQRAVAETLDRRLLLSAVTATANGAHEIDLNITPDSTAYSMQIGRSIDGTNYVTVYSGDVITAFPDTGLSADINYFYNVTDSDDNGSYTSTASATTGPVAPTVTASGNGSSEIDLAVSPDLMATSMQILRDGTQVYSGLPEDTFADTGLSADSTYSYVVNTSNSNGSSSGSASASTGAFAPSVTAVGNGSGEIDLNINADPTASWMQIVRNGASTYSGAVTSAFSDTGLSPDSSFTYTVTTGNAAGSTSGSVIGTTGLINPSVSAVGNGNNEIDLTISPDYDATSMQILRDGVSIYSSGIINSFADAGLGADATYAYTVITTNSIGSSSGSASGTTGPWNPTITATPVSANEIDLVLSSDSTATSIQITRDGAQIYSGASVAAFSDDALAADSSHIYVVTTSSSNGVSTASTSAGTAPAAPTVSAFANGPGEIDLTITPDPLATSMQVLDNGSTIYSGAVIPTFSDTGLSADSMHSLTVVTSDANGSSSASTTATTGILDPVVTAAANGPSEIDLSITPDYYATSMEILRNGVSIYLGGVASTYADTSLAADNSYTYTVITDSSMGSFSSSTGGATACTGPSAPAVAAVSNGGAEIDLTITPDSSATSMEILRDGNPIYSGAVIGTFADTGLVADASYDYAIVNGNSIGSSSASVSAATTFSNPGVSGFGVTGSQIDLTISSDPMTTSMQILRDGTQVYLGSPTNAFVDTGLSPDTAYVYTVITSFGTAGPTDATTGACTVTTGLGTSDPFSVTRGVMSVQEGDAYSGSVGTIADTNPDSSAANFSATFTFNGQSV
ncbi:MAG TPA: hypothetical protein VG326_04040, partial [Tepidisphaeraceae bacterium]|nr:hypothetical protein [Tepidisphaeraceae bacterium]